MCRSVMTYLYLSTVIGVYVYINIYTHACCNSLTCKCITVEIPKPTTTLLASCCLSVTSGPNKRHTLIGHQTQHILLTIQDLATDYSPNPLKATNQYSNSHWPHWCWNIEHGDGREFFGVVCRVFFSLLWGTTQFNSLESVKDLTTPIFFCKKTQPSLSENLRGPVPRHDTDRGSASKDAKLSLKLKPA